MGRSCIALRFLSGSTPLSCVLLDVGLHVGFEDPAQAFPDLRRLGADLNAVLDCVLISHYHIDHCGALPFLTERCRYRGVILTSPPTKAILPMMLNDMLADRGFSSSEVRASVEKCEAVETRQTRVIKQDLEITAYRAGHVLGAVMFHIRYKNASAVYTGDFNATPDRHLGAYEFDCVPSMAKGVVPDVLITESTYGGTTRGSQKSTEREFLDQVQQCLAKGGKVLIPTFAMGRVQEIVSLLESHWERMNLPYPILLCTKEAAGVQEVYRFYQGWGSSRVVSSNTDGGSSAGGMLIPPADTSAGTTTTSASTTTTSSITTRKIVELREPTQAELEEPGPVILIATSAMLVGGLSLKAFRLWAGTERNAVVFPGHCVKGTLGFKLLSMVNTPNGMPGSLDVSNRKSIKDVITMRCSASTAPFSAHTDSKGILQVVHQLKPKNVVLVHGVEVQMKALKERIEREIPIMVNKVFFPSNFETVRVESSNSGVAGGSFPPPPPSCEFVIKSATLKDVCESLELVRTRAIRLGFVAEDPFTPIGQNAIKLIVCSEKNYQMASFFVELDWVKSDVEARLYGVVFCNRARFVVDEERKAVTELFDLVCSKCFDRGVEGGDANAAKRMR